MMRLHHSRGRDVAGSGERLAEPQRVVVWVADFEHPHLDPVDVFDRTRASAAFSDHLSDSRRHRRFQKRPSGGL